MSLGSKREEKEVVTISIPFLPEFPPLFSSRFILGPVLPKESALPGVPSSGLSRARNMTEERSGKGYCEGKCEPSSRAVVPRFHQ